jgi:hypothetical protein
LFTKRKSPTRSVFSIEPVGIRNAWTTSPRITTVSSTARTTASTYSRSVDLVRADRRVLVLAATLALSIRSPPKAV